MKCFIQSNNHYLWTQSRQQSHFPYKLFLFFFCCKLVVWTSFLGDRVDLISTAEFWQFELVVCWVTHFSIQERDRESRADFYTLIFRPWRREYRNTEIQSVIQTTAPELAKVCVSIVHFPLLPTMIQIWFIFQMFCHWFIAFMHSKLSNFLSCNVASLINLSSIFWWYMSSSKANAEKWNTTTSLTSSFVSVCEVYVNQINWN